jgi:class 3 adenylate cyclase/tetratricopeptide (TPR) repeat protein
MLKCPGCGEDNPSRFKLCGYCGTPLAANALLPVHEVRKTVTIVFSDLRDSTALGERLDSEALHEVKERYFAAMAAQIKRHGGKIEKYIGDAIMAVFGLPRAHEDDALRAVRAATGMRSALRKVNEELGPRYGVTLANRTGVNTGEVVAIDDPAADQKLATGDAVNVAARLEAAAPANEIYIGEGTYRLVRDAVDVEPVEPLVLKGKSQPVPAFRLVSAHGQDGNLRRHDTPVVGRDDELAALQGAWDSAVTQRRAQLVTVIGDAGVGKSRLVRELIERLGAGVQLVFGRCLPYGEGITFWPLREMIVSAAGIRQDDTTEQARERLLACVTDAEVADRLASATGLSAASFPLHELYWGARKFLQALAARRPVVAMFDDIHWAEPALLDLLVNLIDTIDDAPVLLLATARHELLEDHAAWGERERSTRLELRPLADAAAAQIVSHLLGSAGLTAELTSRIVEAAEGNPLYVEQMLSMLIDNDILRQEEGRLGGPNPQARITVPPTIRALLEARLDRLERNERAAAEPAAVIGLEFESAAVESLVPQLVREGMDTHLLALARKQFIRPAGADDAARIYRFHHHLVRDVVYNGLLKRTRATLHTQFVRWADGINACADRGREFEEILGYHLEQATLYLAELGPQDAEGVAIGRDAARRLSAAGRRAFARGDMHAAANLLRRATTLLAAEDADRLALLPELAESLMGLGKFTEAKDALIEASAAAHRQSDLRLLASSQLMESLMRLFTGAKVCATEGALPTPSDLIPLLEQHGAHNELATAWRLSVLRHGVAGQYELARQAAERSVRHARLAGNERLVARIGGNLADFALLGPMPVREAIATCEKLIAGGMGDRQAECRIMCKLAQLRAMNGELEAARALYRRGRAMLRDLGQGVFATTAGIDLALVELLGGDLSVAESELRSDYEFLAKAGETYYLSTMAALLARIVRDRGRDDEALALSKAAEAATDDDDVDSQALWRATRAPILARAGEAGQAEELARTAVELVRRTEAPVLQADALSELATVLALAGKAAEAERIIGEAIALYRAKGNQVSAARCEKWAEQLKGR